MNSTFMMHPHKSKVRVAIGEDNCLTITFVEESGAHTDFHFFMESAAQAHQLGQGIVFACQTALAGEPKDPFLPDPLQEHYADRYVHDSNLAVVAADALANVDSEARVEFESRR